MEGLQVIQGEGVAQAYLLVGQGREEAAQRLIRRVLGQGDERGLAKLRRGVHPDVRWVTRAKRLIGINQIRRLQEDARYPPSEAKHKVYVIAEAEALSLEAANSLLRILEDTPSYLVFLLLSPSLDLLPTIVSRCRVIRLMPQAPEAIREEFTSRGLTQEEIDYLLAVTKGEPHRLAQLPLGEGFHPLEERAGLVVELGEMEDGELLKSFDKSAGPVEAREGALELLRRIQGSSSARILNLAAALSKLDRETSKDLLREAVFWFRDLLAASVSDGDLFNLDQEALLRQAGKKVEPVRLLELIPALERARSELEGNANLQLILEASMLRIRGAEC